MVSRSDDFAVNNWPVFGFSADWVGGWRIIVRWLTDECRFPNHSIVKRSLIKLLDDSSTSINNTLPTCQTPIRQSHAFQTCEQRNRNNHTENVIAKYWSSFWHTHTRTVSQRKRKYRKYHRRRKIVSICLTGIVSWTSKQTKTPKQMRFNGNNSNPAVGWMHLSNARSPFWWKSENSSQFGLADS